MDQEDDRNAIGQPDPSAINVPSLDRVEAVARETERNLGDPSQQMLASSVISQIDVLRAWAEKDDADDSRGRAAPEALGSLADGFLKIDGLDMLGEAIIEMLERSGIIDPE